MVPPDVGCCKIKHVQMCPGTLAMVILANFGQCLQKIEPAVVFFESAIPQTIEKGTSFAIEDPSSLRRNIAPSNLLLSWPRSDRQSAYEPEDGRGCWILVLDCTNMYCQSSWQSPCCWYMDATCNVLKTPLGFHL